MTARLTLLVIASAGLLACPAVPDDSPCNDSSECGNGKLCIDQLCSPPLDGGGTDAGVPDGGIAAFSPMPDSPTLLCTDGSGATDCSETSGDPWFGQDGHYDLEQPIYVITGDIVRDEVTGLQWQMTPPAALDLAEADDYCNTLTLSDEAGEVRDWRLPTFAELMSLADLGTIGSLAGDFVAGPVSTYWTSETVQNSSDQYVVDFDQTIQHRWNASQDASVRCVRGATWWQGTLSSGTTPVDPTSGLRWAGTVMQDSTGLQGALSRCENLVENGTEWRLPSLKEWVTVFDVSKATEVRVRDLHPATNAVGDYWTSTPISDSLPSFFGVNLGIGSKIYARAPTSMQAVMCVANAP